MCGVVHTVHCYVKLILRFTESSVLVLDSLAVLAIVVKLRTCMSMKITLRVFSQGKIDCLSFNTRRR